MRELSAEWKTVAAAPRERAEGLWRRFRAAADAVRAHIEPALAQQSAAQADHLAKKIALCEQAEALSNSTDWIAIATTLKNLQSEWKTIGPAPRREEQAVWKRFRAACNAFFTRRQEDLKQRKEVWGGNLEKKEALIARRRGARRLAGARRRVPGAEVAPAQWKAIGPVKKSKSEHVWQKFRAASEKILTGTGTATPQPCRTACRAARSSATSRSARREGRRARLRDRAAREGTEPEDGWQQAGTMPRDAGLDVGRALQPRAPSAPSSRPRRTRSSSTELDIASNTRQLELLCERVEKLAAKTAAATQPAESPAAQRARTSAARGACRQDDRRPRRRREQVEVGGVRSPRRAGRVASGGLRAGRGRRGAHGPFPESVAEVFQLASRGLRDLGVRRVHDVTALGLGRAGFGASRHRSEGASRSAESP